MSDNSYGTNFGPSTPGAINLISGQTNGVVEPSNGRGETVRRQWRSLALSVTPTRSAMCAPTPAGGLVHSAAKISATYSTPPTSPGDFSPVAFNLSTTNTQRHHRLQAHHHFSGHQQTTKADYIPHHQPFQYYASTANPTPARPISVHDRTSTMEAPTTSTTCQDFFDALRPAIPRLSAYIKAPQAIQDGHAGYSDPLMRRPFLLDVDQLPSEGRRRSGSHTVIYPRVR